MSSVRDIDWEGILLDAPTGFVISTRDRDDVEREGGPGAATYGELLPHSARRLLQWLELGVDDVLFDLGSGAGRLVIQTVVETDVGRAIGVELSRNRHATAQHAANRIAAAIDATSRADFTDRLELRREDLRRTDLSTATHVYMAATSFPRPLLEAACRRLYATAPRLRVLVSTRDLPETWCRRFPPIGELDLDMTWAPDIRVFVHGR